MGILPASDMTRLSVLQKRKVPPAEEPRINPKKRRNGLLQSCEPCRKAKLRCDHMMPVCGRCQRRNRATLCVYAAAPMTQAARRSSASPSETAVGSEAAATVVQIRNPQDPPAMSSARKDDEKGKTPDSGVGGTETMSPSVATPVGSISTSKNSGAQVYLGSTSYSSIFDENKGAFGIERDPEPANLQPERRATSATVSEYQIQQGVEVLKLFRDRVMFERFSKRWFTVTQGLIVAQPILNQWAEGVWGTYGTILRDQDPAKLRALSQKIWGNTLRPLQFDGTFTARQWIALSTGDGLRWEAVGLIVTTVGLLASTLMEWDPIFINDDGSQLNRVKLAHKMSDHADLCVAFCRDAESANELYICLLYESCIFQSILSGDAAHSVWTRAGEAYNFLIALGFHQKIEANKDVPFFVAELRKRIFVMAYISDKSFSTFLGRPPRLSKRYCMLQVPLDLSDQELVSDGEELRKALAALDADGWSTNGTLNRGTWARTYLDVSMIREDILELALGVGTENIVERAEQISKRINEKYTGLPRHLRADSETAFGQRLPPLDSLRLVATRMNYLCNELILERVLIKRAGAGTEKLVEIAKRMLKETLAVVMRRDLMRDLQADISDLMAVHGLRTSAILAVELLKQEQGPLPPDRPPPLSRSDTIQDLSVFVSCLGSVDPSDGHFEILQQGRRFLKRVLDIVLTPPAARDAASLAAKPAISPTMPDVPPEAPSLAAFEGVDWNTPIEFDAEVNFLEWLDTVDLGPGPLEEEATAENL